MTVLTTLGPNTPDPYANEAGRSDPGFVPAPRFDDDATYGVRDPVLTWPTQTGAFPAFVCNHPSAAPVASFVFFFSFTLLSSFVILSLLVGVVTIAMQNTMGGVHAANLRAGRDVALKLQHQLNPR